MAAVEQTTNWYINNRTVLEIEITAAFQAYAATQYFARVQAGDVGDFARIDGFLRSGSGSVNNATPAELFVTGNHQTGATTTTPILVTDTRNTLRQLSVVLVDNNGQLEDVGLGTTTAVDLFYDILIPYQASGLTFTMYRYNGGRTTGNLRETYTGVSVASVGDVDFDADTANTIGERTVVFNLYSRPDSVAFTL